MSMCTSYEMQELDKHQDFKEENKKADLEAACLDEMRDIFEHRAGQLATNLANQGCKLTPEKIEQKLRIELAQGE